MLAHASSFLFHCCLCHLLLELDELRDGFVDGEGRIRQTHALGEIDKGAK